MSLSDQMEKLLAGAALTEWAQRRRRAIRWRIFHTINARWPEAQLSVSIFGSYSLGIRTVDSDLDLCILDPSRPLGPNGPVFPISGAMSGVKGLGAYGVRQAARPEWYDVHAVAAAIRERAGPQQPRTAAWNMTFEQVRAVPTARVPLVTFVARDGYRTIKVDIVVNNRVALLNTALLTDYARLQRPVFDPLYYAIRTWLKRAGLNQPNPRSGPRSLSSYAIKLIVVNYMQDQGLLPDLRDPLLLEQLHIKHRHYRYHRDSLQKYGQERWDVTWFRASKTRGNVKTHFATGADGSIYRYYCHDSEDAKAHPSVDDWLEQTSLGAESGAKPIKSFPDLGPPNRVGLHCISDGHVRQGASSQGHDLGELFEDFFPWFYSRIRADETRNKGRNAHARTRAFTTSPDHLPTAEKWPRRWTGLVVQDPFLLDRNQAVNVTSHEVMQKLEKETRRAMKITSQEEDPARPTLTRLMRSVTRR